MRTHYHCPPGLPYALPTSGKRRRMQVKELLSLRGVVASGKGLRRQVLELLSLPGLVGVR